MSAARSSPGQSRRAPPPIRATSAWPCPPRTIRATYADFEGVIPEGEYGAGTVLVWDRGTWENITRKDDKIVPAEKALEQGHLLMHLEGEKISGGYALQRTDTGDDEKWLLVKNG